MHHSDPDLHQIQLETPQKNGGRLAGKDKRAAGFDQLFFPVLVNYIALLVLVKMFLAMSKMRSCHS